MKSACGNSRVFHHILSPERSPTCSSIIHDKLITGHYGSWTAEVATSRKSSAATAEAYHKIFGLTSW